MILKGVDAALLTRPTAATEESSGDLEAPLRYSGLAAVVPGEGRPKRCRWQRRGSMVCWYYGLRKWYLKERGGEDKCGVPRADDTPGLLCVTIHVCMYS